MIILDASVVVDLLIKPPPEIAHLGARLAHERAGHVPHLLDAEVAHALRRLLLGGRLTDLSARRALRELAVMRLKRWPHRALLGRALALRDQLAAESSAGNAVAARVLSDDELETLKALLRRVIDGLTGEEQVS